MRPRSEVTRDVYTLYYYNDFAISINVVILGAYLTKFIGGIRNDFFLYIHFFFTRVRWLSRDLMVRLLWEG